MNIYLIGTLLAIAAFILIGIVAGKKVQDTNDYYVAGRRAPVLLIVGSLIASFLSTGAFMGDTGEVYSGFFMGIVIVGILQASGYVYGAGLFGKYIRRAKVNTVPEYFGMRFHSNRLRILAISSRFDAFAQTFKLTIKRQSSYTIELGSDPAGNIQRILNALASIEKTLPQVERRLETLQQQLAEAKEEVQRPFPQETELNEKSARLAELNALLDMDEKGDDAALGMDEEVTDSELPAPKREIERSADSVKRPSILAQLHEKQAERMAEPKPQKKKSHDMEL